MDDTELDPKLRQRLGRAADAELPAALDERAIARLVQDMQRERLAIRRRKLGVGLVFAVAAAALIGLVLSPREAQPVATSAPACALPASVTIVQVEGQPRIDLGRFGQLAGSDDALLTVESATPCALSLRLSRGTLAGALMNLRPGHLAITTNQGQVVVRGTRFSVTAGEALEVVLLSGKVELVEGQAPALQLAPNQVLRKVRGARTLTRVEQQDSQRIDQLLARRTTRTSALPVPTTLPSEVSDVREPTRAQAKSAAALLEQAELERKAGALANARRLYEAASTRNDQDAEVALLRWVRLELGVHDTARAARLLERHRRRFARGALQAEAAWLHVEVLQARAEHERARDSARALLQRHPGTPQAEAARALLRGP